ncbi:MAG: hypothetical protein A2V52_06105 [Actinobacteria bacterium RBG_19FT_COMBO_54_7]|nr:MAG: hypothetical protein A2V52_06105 [Actinobacteria bacterium RBG_19FT_COMBO_54_7]
MEQMGPAQIKKYLRQLRERRDQYLYYLGQLAYKAGDAGQLQDNEMLEAYNALKEIQAQVDQCENSIAQIKAAREAAKQGARCPHCGSPAMKGAVFCGTCGQSMLQQQPGMVQPPMGGPPPVMATAPAMSVATCPSCSAPTDADTVFCANCGARVEAEAESAEQAAETGTRACRSCGAACGEASFCPECGTKIEE